MKNFHDWFRVKFDLDQQTKRVVFSEREVWMSHVGVNIGFEIDGKKSESLRPVLIFKKLSSETGLIIPLASHQKDGSWYWPSLVKRRVGRYCFNQIRMVDSCRLKYRLEKIGVQEFQNIKAAFVKFVI